MALAAVKVTEDIIHTTSPTSNVFFFHKRFSPFFFTISLYFSSFFFFSVSPFFCVDTLVGFDCFVMWTVSFSNGGVLCRFFSGGFVFSLFQFIFLLDEFRYF